MGFKVGDKVVSVKNPEPYIKAGVWGVSHDIMFCGVRMIDEIKPLNQKGDLIYRIADLWYLEDMLIHEEDATRADRVRLEYCEKCGSPFIEKIHFDSKQSKTAKGNTFNVPGGVASRCMKCGFVEVENGWSGSVLKAMEEADNGSEIMKRNQGGTL